MIEIKLRPGAAFRLSIINSVGAEKLSTLRYRGIVDFDVDNHPAIHDPRVVSALPRGAAT